MIDFTAYRDGTSSDPYMTGAGVLGSDGDGEWNVLKATDTASGVDEVTDIHYADSTTDIATNVTYSFHNADTPSGDVDHSASPLFTNYTSVNSSNASAYIEYTGLEANTLYDFVIFGNNTADGEGRGFVATVGDLTAELLPEPSDAPASVSDFNNLGNGIPVFDGNYLEFDDVETTGSGTLTIGLAAGYYTYDDEFDIAGTQLELVPGQTPDPPADPPSDPPGDPPAVPDPSTLSLLGLGVAALALGRRLSFE